MDPSGRFGLMYRPYHLVGMEAPVSIAKACIYGEPTGAPRAHVGEVVAVAKRRLSPGKVLDGEGGCTVYGALVEASQASADALLPIGLCHGARVLHPVTAGQMVRYADVKLTAGGFARQLREIQDTTFVAPGSQRRTPKPGGPSDSRPVYSPRCNPVPTVNRLTLPEACAHNGS